MSEIDKLEQQQPPQPPAEEGGAAGQPPPPPPPPMVSSVSATIQGLNEADAGDSPTPPPYPEQLPPALLFHCTPPGTAPPAPGRGAGSERCCGWGAPAGSDRLRHPRFNPGRTRISRGGPPLQSLPPPAVRAGSQELGGPQVRIISPPPPHLRRASGVPPSVSQPQAVVAKHAALVRSVIVGGGLEGASPARGRSRHAPMQEHTRISWALPHTSCRQIGCHLGAPRPGRGHPRPF